MKVRKLVWPLLLLCAVSTAFLPACEEKNEEEAAEGAKTTGGETGGAAKEPPTPPPPPPAPATPPPNEVCNTLVAAVKAKDEAKVLALSTAGTATAISQEGSKEFVMTQLGTVTCGAAKIEGDNAMVPLTGGAAPQEAVFVKGPDGWKFDGAAYLTKYPAPEKDKGKGKGKGKDHAKAKTKAKGKHKK